VLFSELADADVRTIPAAGRLGNNTSTSGSLEVNAESRSSTPVLLLKKASEKSIESKDSNKTTTGKVTTDGKPDVSDDSYNLDTGETEARNKITNISLAAIGEPDSAAVSKKTVGNPGESDNSSNGKSGVPDTSKSGEPEVAAGKQVAGLPGDSVMTNDNLTAAGKMGVPDASNKSVVTDLDKSLTAGKPDAVSGAVNKTTVDNLGAPDASNKTTAISKPDIPDTSSKSGVSDANNKSETAGKPDAGVSEDKSSMTTSDSLSAVIRSDSDAVNKTTVVKPGASEVINKSLTADEQDAGVSEASNNVTTGDKTMSVGKIDNPGVPDASNKTTAISKPDIPDTSSKSSVSDANNKSDYMPDAGVSETSGKVDVPDVVNKTVTNTKPDVLDAGDKMKTVGNPAAAVTEPGSKKTIGRPGAEAGRRTTTTRKPDEREHDEQMTGVGIDDYDKLMGGQQNSEIDSHNEAPKDNRADNGKNDIGIVRNIHHHVIDGGLVVGFDASEE